jgi:Cu+-exporting ATPase
MTVSPHTATHHEGRAYYFCSTGCLTKFVDDSARYHDDRASAAVVDRVPEGTIFTCPMHPEIRQVGPGTCPICGLALEPELPVEAAGPNPQLVDMRRRF